MQFTEPRLDLLALLPNPCYNQCIAFQTLLPELLMIGTEVVLVPDFSSPMNSEINNIMDSLSSVVKIYLVPKTPFYESSEAPATGSGQ